MLRPQYEILLHFSAASWGKEWNEGVYTTELLTLGCLASVVCTCRMVDCNSVTGTDNGVMATPGRLDC